MSSRDWTKSVAMTTLFGKCGGCGAKVDVLTRGDLPSRPNGTTASARKPEGAAEVSRGHSRTADRSEGPNESRRGRPAGFAVVETQQLSLWDRLPGSESPGATVRQTTAAETEPDPAATIVMEEVVRKENLEQAMKRVVANKGGPGVDGMRVDELKRYLKTHWPDHKAQLLDGRYKPQPIKAVDIPKPGGGKRRLGIPTVLDRFIQQAILQVMAPVYDPTFSPHSYGFRPGRNAHQAVRQAQAYIQEGYNWVVDIDLEKFFDRVNHDILMGRIARRVTDKRILRLIRLYLQAGAMLNGVVQERYEGTPQGGPLSPLLSNILLDELDKELERRGHNFCRYADDANIYVKSERAGQRVMDSVERFLAELLKLKINREKSAVTEPQKRSFLGFSFTGGEYRKIRFAPKSVKNFKRKVKQITGRSRGITLERMIQELNGYTRGWMGYYRIAETPTVLSDLDCWIRRRLRSAVAKQWFKSCKARFRGLNGLGVDPKQAAITAVTRRGPWAMSNMKAFKLAMPNKFFAERGLLTLSGYAS
jgi:RNA-directed DNA polymerase